MHQRRSEYILKIKRKVDDDDDDDIHNYRRIFARQKEAFLTFSVLDIINNTFHIRM
jgi:hypothetical protein